MKKEKLLPCPFCGGKAESSFGKNADSTVWRYIECTKCGASAEPNKWNERKCKEYDLNWIKYTILRRLIQHRYPKNDNRLQRDVNYLGVVCSAMEAKTYKELQKIHKQEIGY